MYSNPLIDKEFLKELDKNKSKKIYIKVQSLNFNEEPKEEIQGKVTNGSINKDGTSIIRRTCSLTIVAEDINIDEYLWSLNTKIKILIGVENTINSKYEDIIWFNQGIFVLTSFNVSYGVNNYTINLSGQDKMCLLNGSIGGTLPASIDFKKETFQMKTYTEKSFGEKYISNFYYIAKEYEWQIDNRNSFTENENYFIKRYDDYVLAAVDSENYKKDYYYIVNPNLYEQCQSSDWDNVNQKPLVTLYKKEIEGEDTYYTVYDISNLTTNFDITKYYKYKRYTPYTMSKGYSEFLQYFIYDEDKMFKEVMLDKKSFDPKAQYYIDNMFVKDTGNSYNPDQDYYEFNEGTYEHTALSPYSYEKGLYFNRIVKDPNSFELSQDAFDFNEYYYQKEDDNYTLVDFLSSAYNSYQVGIYYILQNDEYVLSMDKYNPAQTYYELDTYKEENDIPIKTIIKEAVHTWGKEPYHNIIINDIDDYGLLLKEYRGNVPAYLLINNGVAEGEEGAVENFITNPNQKCYLIDSEISDSTINLYKSLYEDELTLLRSKYNLKQIDLNQYTIARENIINLFKDIMKVQETTIGNENLIVYNTFLDNFNISPSRIFMDNKRSDELKTYTVMRLQYGDAAGYELKDLTYPEDLICSIGESLTSVLDKIVDKLQGFEYFYDIDGRFVFQKKKTYLNTSWNNIITTDANFSTQEGVLNQLTEEQSEAYYSYILSNPLEAVKTKDMLLKDFVDFVNKVTGAKIQFSDKETYVENAAYTSAIQYSFENNDLIISIQNTPKLDNLKNDYSVWGMRKTLNGTEVPIHVRYAIDQKPYAYITFPKTKFNYVKNQDELEIETIEDMEFLVQEGYINEETADDVINGFALDETGDESEDDTARDILERTSKIRIHPVFYKGKTYAGIYYRFIVCDWREVIYQMALDYYKHNQENDFLSNLSDYNTFDTANYNEDLQNEFMEKIKKDNGRLYLNGITGYEQYYVDLYSFWRDIYNPNPEIKIGYKGGFYENKEWVDVIEDYSDFNCDFYLPEREYNNFYKNKIEQKLNEYQKAIDSLKKELESYENSSDYKNIQDEINNLNKQLTEEEKKRLSLSEQIFANINQSLITDPEGYERASFDYDEAVKAKKNAIKDLEKQITTILQKDFELL